MILLAFVALIVFLSPTVRVIRARRAKHEVERKEQEIKILQRKFKAISSLGVVRQTEDIKKAAVLWGIDSNVIGDVYELLESVECLKEELGEEFVEEASKEAMLRGTSSHVHRVSKKGIMKCSSKKHMQLLHRLDVVSKGIRQVNMSKFFIKTQTKGDLGDESININV